MLERQRYSQGIHEDVRAIDTALAAGPDVRVPTCPEWTVRQLVAHVDTVFRTTVLRHVDPATLERLGLAGVPHGFGAVAQVTADVLMLLDPDTVVGPLLRWLYRRGEDVTITGDEQLVADLRALAAAVTNTA